MTISHHKASGSPTLDAFRLTIEYPMQTALMLMIPLEPLQAFCLSNTGLTRKEPHSEEPWAQVWFLSQNSTLHPLFPHRPKDCHLYFAMCSIRASNTWTTAVWSICVEMTFPWMGCNAMTFKLLGAGDLLAVQALCSLVPWKLLKLNCIASCQIFMSDKFCASPPSESRSRS